MPRGILSCFAVLAALPVLFRNLRSRWGSPEIRATLHAVAISVALDLLPLLLILIRGQRSPKK